MNQLPRVNIIVPFIAPEMSEVHRGPADLTSSNTTNITIVVHRISVLEDIKRRSGSLTSKQESELAGLKCLKTQYDYYQAHGEPLAYQPIGVLRRLPVDSIFHQRPHLELYSAAQGAPDFRAVMARQGGPDFRAVMARQDQEAAGGPRFMEIQDADQGVVAQFQSGAVEAGVRQDIQITLVSATPPRPTEPKVVTFKTIVPTPESSGDCVMRSPKAKRTLDLPLDVPGSFRKGRASKQAPGSSRKVVVQTLVVRKPLPDHQKLDKSRINRGKQLAKAARRGKPSDVPPTSPPLVPEMSRMVGVPALPTDTEGNVYVNGTRLELIKFKMLRGPNAQEYLVYADKFCFTLATCTWRTRVLFAGYEDMYAGFNCDVDKDPRFTQVLSLKSYDLEQLAWWVKPGVFIPDITSQLMPGESKHYPDHGVYAVRDSVLILAKDGEKPKRGFVHSTYKRMDGERIYHVYTVTDQQVVFCPRCPRPPCMYVSTGSFQVKPHENMGVYTKDELAPPLLTFKRVKVELCWWIAHCEKYEDTDAFDFCYWPEPKRGWQVGHYVGVYTPFRSEYFPPYIPARVVEILEDRGSDRLLKVEFPKLGELADTMERQCFEEVLASKLVGPNTSWSNHYPWWQTPSTPVITPRIFTPSLAASPPRDLWLPGPALGGAAHAAEGSLECQEELVSSFFKI